MYQNNHTGSEFTEKLQNRYDFFIEGSFNKPDKNQFPLCRLARRRLMSAFILAAPEPCAPVI